MTRRFSQKKKEKKKDDVVVREKKTKEKRSEHAQFALQAQCCAQHILFVEATVFAAAERTDAGRTRTLQCAKLSQYLYEEMDSDADGRE